MVGGALHHVSGSFLAADPVADFCELGPVGGSLLREWGARRAGGGGRGGPLGSRCVPPAPRTCVSVRVCVVVRARESDSVHRSARSAPLARFRCGQLCLDGYPTIALGCFCHRQNATTDVTEFF